MSSRRTRAVRGASTGQSENDEQQEGITLNTGNKGNNHDDDDMDDPSIAQFLAITGSSDPSTASNYLEMGGGNVEIAIGLFLEHNPSSSQLPSTSATSSNRMTTATTSSTRRRRSGANSNGGARGRSRRTAGEYDHDDDDDDYNNEDEHQRRLAERRQRRHHHQQQQPTSHPLAPQQGMSLEDADAALAASLAAADQDDDDTNNKWRGQVRAPDATRTMRLMDDGGVGGMRGLYQAPPYLQDYMMTMEEGEDNHHHHPSIPPPLASALGAAMAAQDTRRQPRSTTARQPYAFAVAEEIGTVPAAAADSFTSDTWTRPTTASANTNNVAMGRRSQNQQSRRGQPGGQGGGVAAAAQSRTSATSRRAHRSAREVVDAAAVATAAESKLPDYDDNDEEDYDEDGIPSYSDDDDNNNNDNGGYDGRPLNTTTTTNPSSSQQANPPPDAYLYDDEDDDDDDDVIVVDHVMEDSPMILEDDNQAAATATARSRRPAPPVAAPHGAPPPRLSDLFAPPTHLFHQGGGGFAGARLIARDSRRWLLVNIQRDSEFSSHALNRDVWRNDLVENLIREGFIFWQSDDSTVEGSQFVQRYHVQAFPHISMIDPRTGRLLWKKEGWTQQQHPLTAEAFAEIAMDFCSRNSLDRPPPITAAPPRLGSGDGAPSMHQTGKHHPDDDDNHQQHNNNNNITNNNVHHMTEEEQLMAAVRASMEEQAASETNRRNGARPGSTSDKDDDGDDEVQVVDLPTATTNATATTSAASSSSSSAWFQALCDTPVPVWDDATTTGSVGGPARISFRMPNGSRVVRTFAGTDPVQMMYAFVAQSLKEDVVQDHQSNNPKKKMKFTLMAGFPPRDLASDTDKSIAECSLHGEAITVRWDM